MNFTYFNRVDFFGQNGFFEKFLLFFKRLGGTKNGRKNGQRWSKLRFRDKPLYFNDLKMVPPEWGNRYVYNA